MRQERGQGIVEIALWLVAGVVVIGVAVFAVRWANARGEKPLTPEEQAYVQAVAMQQAASYIAAVATQQAEAPSLAPPPAAPAERVNAPAPAAPSAPPAAPAAPSVPSAPPPPPAQNPPVAVPTNTPKPPPTSVTATPDDSAQLTACHSKLQDEYSKLLSHEGSHPEPLVNMTWRLQNDTPAVINECAAVLSRSAEDAAIIRSICGWYDDMAPDYKPQGCSLV